MSLSGQVYLTDKPNQVALRLHGVRAGWVPLPLDQLLQRVRDAARQNGVDLLWSQQDGDPVAMFQVPSKLERYPGRDIHLETWNWARARCGWPAARRGRDRCRGMTNERNPNDEE